jgi:hypothetical protein
MGPETGWRSLSGPLVARMGSLYLSGVDGLRYRGQIGSGCPLLHIARGREYRGRRVRQGPVVYVACEGERGFKARAEAYRQKFLGEEESVQTLYLLVGVRCTSRRIP